MTSRHALWKGTIQLGLVTVPVKLNVAVKEERIHFSLLHDADGAKLHQVMVCAGDGKPVPAQAQVKGYEVGEGRYVILGPGELEALDPEAGKAIEVHEFVNAEAIDLLLIERVYSLEPDTAAAGFSELVEALRETGLAGVCTWTMRKRAYLGLLTPRGDSLRLCVLHRQGEVVAASTLGLPETAVSEKELAIGRELISMLSAPFNPGKYANEHQRKLQELIEKKARGEEIPLAEPVVLETTPSDGLLAALEASLKKVA